MRASCGGRHAERDAVSSDAARDPDAPIVAYCTRFPSATFCADFSEGMLPGRWDILNTNGAGASAMLGSKAEKFQGAPTLFAGDAYQDGLTSTWDVRYDDVLVNIQ